MDNENNKISLEKNENEANNSLTQNDNAEQQNYQNMDNDNKYSNKDNPYGDNSWSNAGYQDMNNQQTSRSTFNPSGFAIAGLVLGILSLVCCCIWYISGILAILGLVFSIIVLVKNMPGRGMAIAGAICSGIGLLIAVFMLICVIGIGSYMTPTDYQNIIDKIEQMQ